jgi:putative permease
MTGILKNLTQKYFADPQAVYLAFLLVLGFSVVIFMGDMLLPVFAGLIIAYLLDELVQLCQKCGAKRSYSVVAVFILYIAIFSFIFLALVPLLFVQVGEFFELFGRGGIHSLYRNILVYFSCLNSIIVCSGWRVFRAFS